MHDEEERVRRGGVMASVSPMRIDDAVRHPPVQTPLRIGPCRDSRVWKVTL